MPIDVNAGYIRGVWQNTCVGQATNGYLMPEVFFSVVGMVCVCVEKINHKMPFLRAKRLSERGLQVHDTPKCLR